MPPRKNIIQEDSDEPQVPKMASKRTLTPEQLSNLARARQKAQELRRKAKEDREDKAKMDGVEKEIEKKIKKTVNKKKVLHVVDDEPELQEEEYIQPSDVPTEVPLPPQSTEIVESAKTIKQKKKIIFEDSGSDDESNEHIIVIRKKTEKKEKLPEPEPVRVPVFYREAPMRPINPFQRNNADIYRR